MSDHDDVPSATLPDLRPSADRLVDLYAAVEDSHLDAPTPCPGWTVRDLLAHLGGLSHAFTLAATKDLGPVTDTPPTEHDATLGDDWREAFPGLLEALVEAWQDPAAHDGMTRAGGVDLPGGVAAVVALDEITLHGWDLARALGRPYDLDEPTGQVVLGFVEQVAEDPGDGGLFGPAHPVTVDAPLVDRIVALAGRDPGWQPT